MISGYSTWYYMEEPKEECTGIDVEFDITILKNWKSLKLCFKDVSTAIEAYLNYSL